MNVTDFIIAVNEATGGDPRASLEDILAQVKRAAHNSNRAIRYREVMNGVFVARDYHRAEWDAHKDTTFPRLRDAINHMADVAVND